MSSRRTRRWLYQSLAMGLGYLSQGRVDILRAVRELAEGVSTPRERHMQIPKHMRRYLTSRPQLVQIIPRQDTFTHFTVFCDTDHDGCVSARKSTTGVVVSAGKAFVRSISREQFLIAHSSGEAEYYDLASAVSESLGEHSFASDWGMRIGIHILMDATAGAAIGSRRGFGRVSHLSTLFLWVQGQDTPGRAHLGKVHMSENPMDILTKPVSRQSIADVLDRMGLRVLEGQSSLAFATTA